jgi:hypothetical protein
MLRITFLQTPVERRLVLEGKLIGISVRELESAWESLRSGCQECRCVVDLTDLTVIDQCGKATLMAMIGSGARLVACGAYNEYLAEQLTNRARGREEPPNGCARSPAAKPRAHRPRRSRPKKTN